MSNPRSASCWHPRRFKSHPPPISHPPSPVVAGCIICPAIFFRAASTFLVFRAAFTFTVLAPTTVIAHVYPALHALHFCHIIWLFCHYLHHVEIIELILTYLVAHHCQLQFCKPILKLIDHILPIFWTEVIRIVSLFTCTILVEDLIKASVTIFIHLVSNSVVYHRFKES